MSPKIKGLKNNLLAQRIPLSRHSIRRFGVHVEQIGILGYMISWVPSDIKYGHMWMYFNENGLLYYHDFWLKYYTGAGYLEKLGIDVNVIEGITCNVQVLGLSNIVISMLQGWMADALNTNSTALCKYVEGISGNCLQVTIRFSLLAPRVINELGKLDPIIHLGAYLISSLGIKHMLIETGVNEFDVERLLGLIFSSFVFVASRYIGKDSAMTRRYIAGFIRNALGLRGGVIVGVIELGRTAVVPSSSANVLIIVVPLNRSLGQKKIVLAITDRNRGRGSLPRGYGWDVADLRGIEGLLRLRALVYKLGYMHSFTPAYGLIGKLSSNDNMFS